MTRLDYPCPNCGRVCDHHFMGFHELPERTPRGVRWYSYPSWACKCCRSGWLETHGRIEIPEPKTEENQS
jgi:hypothetical protein